MGNIVDGFKLMAIGMGMVFCFLILMVIIMQVVAKLLAPYAHVFAEQQTNSSNTKKRRPQVKQKGNNDEIVTAVTAAVHKYRAEH